MTGFLTDTVFYNQDAVVTGSTDCQCGVCRLLLPTCSYDPALLMALCNSPIIKPLFIMKVPGLGSVDIGKFVTSCALLGLCTRTSF